MKYAVVLLILCASCTFRRETPEAGVEKPQQATVPKIISTPDPSKNQDKEQQKILHWFEQMDAILRESLWVVRQERAPQGKSIFGKMQRALLVSLKQKLANKSLFKCDVYSMNRKILGLDGVPQSAEVFHQCSVKESFIPIGDWDHSNHQELSMNFRGGNLSEVLGFATGILSPKIQCKLKSNENGTIEKFSCENLMLDYNPAKNQVLRFVRFEYEKSAKSILHIKAEVLENLDPVRKIEVDVPMEGAISVTETVLQAPEYLAKQVPVAAKASPAVNPQEAPDGQNENENQNPQQEGVIESNDQGFAPSQEQTTPVPEIPRELNTR